MWVNHSWTSEMESPHLAVWKSKIVGGKNPHTLEKMFDMSYVINCIVLWISEKSSELYKK